VIEMNIEKRNQHPLKPFFKAKPNTATGATIGAVTLAVLGALVAGPIGAFIGGGLGGSIGGYYGAKADEHQNKQ
jgi:uncharacterized membrane protein